MAEDLARGRQTEADAILGVLIRTAREEDVPAPVLAALAVLMRTAESR